MAVNKPVLGYWDLRALGEACRMMLDYCGCDYEDKRYVMGDAPDYDLSDWLNEKTKLGLDFPNLPYYIDGDIKLTQSVAILRHLARKNNLIPTTEKEVLNCDMTESEYVDFRNEFYSLVFRPDFETQKLVFFSGFVTKKLQYLDQFLTSRTWLAGNTLTHVDFAFCELLDQVRTMEPDCMKKYENVSKYVENFFKLEKIAAYRQSSRFKTFPICGKMAKWGGQTE